jgi:protein involved in polysaccharide export with SLBB domain
MKGALLLILALCFFSGCAHSGQRSNTTPRSANFPTPESSQPQAEFVSHRDPPPFIYVRGEFINPGRYMWTNGMTLKDAIAMAGGLTRLAWERILVRHWDGSSSKRYSWDSKHLLKFNPDLEPGDSVINLRQ